MKIMLDLYTVFYLNVKKAVLKSCSMEVFEPLPFISELGRNRKHRNVEVPGNGRPPRK